MLDLPEAVPLLVGGLGSLGGLLWLASKEDEEDQYDRTRASKMAAQPPYPAPPPPPPSAATPVGAALLPALATDAFPAAWREAVTLTGASSAAANAPADDVSLQARIASVQALTQHRRALADLLGVAVERSFIEEALVPLPSASALLPGVALPDNAATLVRVSQQFPGQSARQVRAYVLESAPSNDPAVVGRFDRLQAAKLYAGCAQFGYFLGQIFRGQAHLDESTRLAPDEARAITAAIERASKLTKSEAAWAAVSRRAATVFGLARGADGADGDGFDSLAPGEFTAGVQVVASAQQEEFFARPADGEAAEGRSGDAGGASADSAAAAAGELPTADLIRFHAEALQCLLAEGCLYGWLLWGAEAEVASLLARADGAAEALLVPPATP